MTDKEYEDFCKWIHEEKHVLKMYKPHRTSVELWIEYKENKNERTR